MKRKQTAEELEKRRQQYAELIKDPSVKKKFQQQRREYHQRIYAEKKANPEKWKEHLKQQKEYRKNNPEVSKQSTIRSRLRSPEKWLWSQAKKRAKDKGLEFTLELSDIIIPEVCPIMGIKLEYIPEGYYDYSPSIDRVDSSKGYTRDNIQIISSIANRMKWNATKEQLLTFCKGVLALEKGV